MALTQGDRLGPYAIVSRLGSGGMGEVYQATDTRLGRTVAIKVLSGRVATDPDLRARFDREARAIAGLSHPHICALHDIGRESGLDFLVMEHLEGQTLESRLERGALTPGEALTRAVEIAGALDAAHRAGIVHRDLKPGNVMLTAGGAKLLDFGIAKRADGTADPSGDDDSLTVDGAIVGTPRYMAPEQLKGLGIDGRADIFALGALLYEMLTGEKAFPGESAASVIATVLDRDPTPLRVRIPDSPPTLERVVHTCLAKNPQDRWQSARDLQRELRWLSETAEAGLAEDDPPRWRTSPTLRWVVLALGVVSGIALLSSWLSPSPLREPRVARVRVGVDPALELAGGSQASLVMSPDGRHLVFAGATATSSGLFVRDLDQGDARWLDGTEGGRSPFLSPDGAWVGFWADGMLKKVRVAGGPVTTICRADNMGAAWGADDIIVFANVEGGLWQVDAQGGDPRPLTTVDTADGEVGHRLPHFLADGRRVLFTIRRRTLGDWENARVAVHSLPTGEQSVLLENAADARYVATGHLVYARAGTLMAAPFDAQALQVTGPTVAVVDDVLQAVNLRSIDLDTGAAAFSVSREGTLAYVAGGVWEEDRNVLVWVDRDGQVEQLPLEPRHYLSPRLSPDGQKLGFATLATDPGVWVYDLTRESLSRLSDGGSWAAWTPDGRHIAFGYATIGPRNIFWRPADGSGPAERLTHHSQRQAPASWSPDGEELVVVNSDGDIWAVRRNGADWTATSILDGDALEVHPTLSPDGAWLAYASDESGRFEVYVQDYPDLSARFQVSTAGGREPLWSHDGRELFYFKPAAERWAPEQLWMARVETEPGFVAAVPRHLFTTSRYATNPSRNYDVTHDDRRFILVQPHEGTSRAPMNQVEVVLDWLSELAERVPTE